MKQYKHILIFIFEFLYLFWWFLFFYEQQKFYNMHYLKKALLFVFILEFSINFYAQDTTAVITDKPLDAEIVQWLNAYLGNYNLDYKSLSADWDYKNKYAFDQILQIAYNDDKFKGKEDPDYAVKIALLSFNFLYTDEQSDLKSDLASFLEELKEKDEIKENLIPYLRLKMQKVVEGYNNKVAELEKKNAELKKDLAEQKKDLAQKEAIIEQYKERERELKSIIENLDSDISELREVKIEIEENIKKIKKRIEEGKARVELLDKWLDMQKEVQEAIEKK